MAKRLSVKTNKTQATPQHRITDTHELECRECGAIATKSISTTAYTCWECVAEMVDNSILPAIKRPAGFPRGWKFMNEFVHSNGTVYHRGVEQPNLKGKLKPTEIKQTPKDTRSKAQKANEKQETLLQISNLKKQIKKETRSTYRRKLESQLKQLQKQL